jgi:ParB/RepB/Spo0J family partition protein
VLANEIALADIDVADTRFQHRLVTSSDDLLESIRSYGQRTPVHLAGERPPFVIVDGFRRVDALRRLGRSSALAVVEHGATEKELFAISFAENVRRRSYSAYDKAHAIWQAIHRCQLHKSDVASLLGLSLRQVDRYLALLTFAAPLREAVGAGRLSMAHAVVLHRAAPADVSPWIDDITASRLSAAELARRMRRSPRRRDGGTLLVRDALGFRMRAIRYRHDLDEAAKRRIWGVLESAMRIVAESSRRSRPVPGEGRRDA